MQMHFVQSHSSRIISDALWVQKLSGRTRHQHTRGIVCVHMVCIKKTATNAPYAHQFSPTVCAVLNTIPKSVPSCKVLQSKDCRAVAVNM